jgi:hypothetical protein
MLRSRQNTFDSYSAMKLSYPKFIRIGGDNLRPAPVLDKKPRPA